MKLVEFKEASNDSPVWLNPALIIKVVKAGDSDKYPSGTDVFYREAGAVKKITVKDSPTDVVDRINGGMS